MILYNLRSDTSGAYRITKFVDGEAEGSYVVSNKTCECPAGPRPTCRHRQMLPTMLGRQLLDAPWFWDFDRKAITDFSGGVVDQYHTVPAEEAARISDETPNVAVGLPRSNLPASWRRI